MCGPVLPGMLGARPEASAFFPGCVLGADGAASGCRNFGQTSAENDPLAAVLPSGQVATECDIPAAFAPRQRTWRSPKVPDLAGRACKEFDKLLRSPRQRSSNVRQSLDFEATCVQQSRGHELLEASLEAKAMEDPNDSEDTHSGDSCEVVDIMEDDVATDVEITEDDVNDHLNLNAAPDHYDHVSEGGALGKIIQKSVRAARSFMPSRFVWFGVGCSSPHTDISAGSRDASDCQTNSTPSPLPSSRGSTPTRWWHAPFHKKRLNSASLFEEQRLNGAVPAASSSSQGGRNRCHSSPPLGTNSPVNADARYTETGHVDSSSQWSWARPRPSGKSQPSLQQTEEPHVKSYFASRVSTPTPSDPSVPFSTPTRASNVSAAPHLTHSSKPFSPPRPDVPHPRSCTPPAGPRSFPSSLHPQAWDTNQELWRSSTPGCDVHHNYVATEMPKTSRPVRHARPAPPKIQLPTPPAETPAALPVGLSAQVSSQALLNSGQKAAEEAVRRELSRISKTPDAEMRRKLLKDLQRAVHPDKWPTDTNWLATPLFQLLQNSREAVLAGQFRS